VRLAGVLAPTGQREELWVGPAEGSERDWRSVRRQAEGAFSQIGTPTLGRTLDCEPGHSMKIGARHRGAPFQLHPDRGRCFGWSRARGSEIDTAVVLAVDRSRVVAVGISQDR